MMMKNIVDTVRNVKRHVGGQVGGWSLVLGCLFLTALSGELRAQDAIPQADISVPPTIEMGTDFPFTVSFENASSDVTGYGPYVDIAYGHTGKDGSWNPLHPLPGAGDANAFDGLTVSPTVTFLGTILPASSIFDIMFDDTANGGLGMPHPFALNAAGEPVYVKTTDFAPAGRFQNGDRFMVVQLPFGSFTPEQQLVMLSLSGFVSELSDIGETLPISVRGGFMFGNDPLNNPTLDPSLIGSQVDGDPGVEPTLLNLSKTYIGPEDETATGPNFPRRYQIVVSVAPGQVIENLRVIDQLPDTMQFTQVTATTRADGAGAITPITIPLTTVPGARLITILVQSPVRPQRMISCSSSSSLCQGLMRQGLMSLMR